MASMKPKHILEGVPEDSEAGWAPGSAFAGGGLQIPLDTSQEVNEHRRESVAALSKMGTVTNRRVMFETSMKADTSAEVPLARRSWRQPWRKPKQQDASAAAAAPDGSAQRPLGAAMAALRRSAPDVLQAASDAVEACGTPRGACPGNASPGRPRQHRALSALTPRGNRGDDDGSEGGRTPREGGKTPRGGGGSPLLKSLQGVLGGLRRGGNSSALSRQSTAAPAHEKDAPGAEESFSPLSGGLSAVALPAEDALTATALQGERPAEAAASSPAAEAAATVLWPSLAAQGPSGGVMAQLASEAASKAGRRKGMFPVQPSRRRSKSSSLSPAHPQEPVPPQGDKIEQPADASSRPAKAPPPPIAVQANASCADSQAVPAPSAAPGGQAGLCSIEDAEASPTQLRITHLIEAQSAMKLSGGGVAAIDEAQPTDTSTGGVEDLQPEPCDSPSAPGHRSSRRAAAEESIPVTSPIMKLPKLDLTPVLAAARQSLCEPTSTPITSRQQEMPADSAPSSKGESGVGSTDAKGESSSPMEAQIEQALSRYHSLHEEDSATAWPVSSAASGSVSEAASIGSMQDGAEEQLRAGVDDLSTAREEQHPPEEQQLPGSAAEQTAEALLAPDLDRRAVSASSSAIAEGGAVADGYMAEADSPIREVTQGTPYHGLVVKAFASALAEVPEEATSHPALLASSAQDGTCDAMPQGGRAFDGQAAAPATEAELCAGVANGINATVPVPVAPSPLFHVRASPGRQLSEEGSPMLQATLELPSPPPITVEPAQNLTAALPLEYACSKPLAAAPAPESPSCLPTASPNTAAGEGEADSTDELSQEGIDAQPAIIPAQPLAPSPRHVVGSAGLARAQDTANTAESPSGASSDSQLPVQPISPAPECCLQQEPELAADAGEPAASAYPAVCVRPEPMGATDPALPVLELQMADLSMVQPQLSHGMAPAEQDAVRAIADELLLELQSGGGTSAATQDRARQEAALSGAPGGGEAAAAEGAAHTASPEEANAQVEAQKAHAAERDTADGPPLLAPAEACASAPIQTHAAGRAAAPSPRASPRGSPMSSPRSSAGFPSPGSSPRGGAPSAGRSPSLIRPLSPLGRLYALATPPLPGRPASAGSSVELDGPLEEAVDELISSICGTPFQELPQLPPAPAGMQPSVGKHHPAVRTEAAAMEPARAGEGAEQDSGQATLEATASAGMSDIGGTDTTPLPPLPAEQPIAIVACRPGSRATGLQLPECNDENAEPDQAPAALPAGSERSARSPRSSPLPTPKGGKAQTLAPDLAASPGALRSPLSRRPLADWQLPALGADAAEPAQGQPRASTQGDDVGDERVASIYPAEAATSRNQTRPDGNRLEPTGCAVETALLEGGVQLADEVRSPQDEGKSPKGSAGTARQGTAVRLGAAAAAVAALPAFQMAPAHSAAAAAAESLMSPATALAHPGGSPAAGVTPPWRRGGSVLAQGTPANSPMTAEVPRPAPRSVQLLEGAADLELPTPPSAVPFPGFGPPGSGEKATPPTAPRVTDPAPFLSNNNCVFSPDSPADAQQPHAGANGPPLDQQRFAAAPVSMQRAGSSEGGAAPLEAKFNLAGFSPRAAHGASTGRASPTNPTSGDAALPKQVPAAAEAISSCPGNPQQPAGASLAGLADAAGASHGQHAAAPANTPSAVAEHNHSLTANGQPAPSQGGNHAGQLNHKAPATAPSTPEGQQEDPVLPEALEAHFEAALAAEPDAALLQSVDTSTEPITAVHDLEPLGDGDSDDDYGMCHDDAMSAPGSPAFDDSFAAEAALILGSLVTPAPPTTRPSRPHLPPVAPPAILAEARAQEEEDALREPRAGQRACELAEEAAAEAGLLGPDTQRLVQALAPVLQGIFDDFEQLEEQCKLHRDGEGTLRLKAGKLAEETGRLNRQLLQQEAEKDQLRRAHGETEAQFKALYRGKYAPLKEAHARCASEADRLRVGRAAAADEAEKWRAQVALAQLQVCKACMDAEAAAAQNQRLQSQLQAQAAVEQQSAEAVAAAEAAAQRERRRVAAAEQQLHMLQRQQAALSAAAEEADTKVAAAQAARDRAVAEGYKKEEEAMSLRKRLAEFAAENGKFADVKAVLKAKVAQLERGLAEKSEECKQLMGMCSNLMSEVEAMRAGAKAPVAVS